MSEPKPIRIGPGDIFDWNQYIEAVRKDKSYPPIEIYRSPGNREYITAAGMKQLFEAMGMEDFACLNLKN